LHRFEASQGFTNEPLMPARDGGHLTLEGSWSTIRLLEEVEDLLGRETFWTLNSERSTRSSACHLVSSTSSPRGGGCPRLTSRFLGRHGSAGNSMKLKRAVNEEVVTSSERSAAVRHWCSVSIVRENEDGGEGTLSGKKWHCVQNQRKLVGLLSQLWRSG